MVKEKEAAISSMQLPSSITAQSPLGNAAMNQAQRRLAHKGMHMRHMHMYISIMDMVWRIFMTLAPFLLDWSKSYHIPPAPVNPQSRVFYCFLVVFHACKLFHAPCNPAQGLLQ